MHLGARTGGHRRHLPGLRGKNPRAGRSAKHLVDPAKLPRLRSLCVRTEIRRSCRHEHEQRPCAVLDRFNAANIKANAATVDNVRLWERDLLMQTFKQLQEIRTYYDFVSVDDVVTV